MINLQPTPLAFTAQQHPIAPLPPTSRNGTPALYVLLVWRNHEQKVSLDGSANANGAKWADDVYIGAWKDDEQHGQGSFRDFDMSTDNGYFMNDEFAPKIYTDMGLTQGSPEHSKCVLKLMETVMTERD